MFDALSNAAERDPTIAWAIQFEPLVLDMSVDGGEDCTIRTGPNGIDVAAGLSGDADVTLMASQDDWTKFVSAKPPVGYQALSSMAESGHLKLELRDAVKYFRHSLMLEKLFGSLRPTVATNVEPYSQIEIEPVTGRYLRLNLQGRPHRLYFEEAGEGIPLLCLHTAGSDGRQYRALMNDPEVTKHFRVIAFDLPRHGKSAPPPGFESEPYMLTTDVYVDTIMEVVRALKLNQPVVMGCSIGGRAVLHLALRHGESFRAAIGLQSAMHAESKLGEELGLGELYPLHRPDVHGGEASAASVMQLMSSHTPTNEKWETLWYYMQGGPGVFAGDLFYYFADGDLRNGLIDGLDTNQCPLYLLTGEYDLSATPEMTRELAEAVNATHFEIMKGVGHFPMSEDPDTFRTYLIPVLDQIRASAA